MTDPLVMLQNRDKRILHHKPDQALAASRNNQVNILFLLEKGIYGHSVSYGYNLYTGFRKPCFPERLLDDIRQDDIGVQGFRPSAQDNGISGLEAQTCRVHCYVRP